MAWVTRPSTYVKGISSRNRCRKQRPNRCIVGDAILPQTRTKLTKKRGPKFGALLWRHLTPQRKTQHNCTTTVRPAYNCSKKISENLLPVWIFSANKHVHSEPFLDYFYELWHLLSALGSDVQKKFYIWCTSTFLALNYCSGISFKTLSYLHEVLRTNFSVDFWNFRNFGPQLLNNFGAT